MKTKKFKLKKSTTLDGAPCWKVLEVGFWRDKIWMFHHSTPCSDWDTEREFSTAQKARETYAYCHPGYNVVEIT